MHVRTSLIALTVACVVAGASAAWAGTESASQAFTEGQALLAKGEFDGALKALKAAAVADPENKEYDGEFKLLRRALNMREQLKAEEDADVWQQMSRALYTYYRDHNVNGEAVAVAGKLHEKVNTGESAALLADAQLALDQNDAAVKVLDGVAADQRTPRTDILRGVALARVGKLPEAKAVAAKVELDKDAEARVVFDAARLEALVGNQQNALNALQRAFEATPANWLDGLKAEAKASKDLQSVAGGEDFAKVLKTESKVKSGCGGCPMAGKDGKCTAQQKEGKGKAGGCEHEKADKAKEKDAGCGHDKAGKPEKE